MAIFHQFLAILVTLLAVTTTFMEGISRTKKVVWDHHLHTNEHSESLLFRPYFVILKCCMLWEVLKNHNGIYSQAALGLTPPTTLRSAKKNLRGIFYLRLLLYITRNKFWHKKIDPKILFSFFFTDRKG